MSNPNDRQRKALGKGLSALLPARPAPASAPPEGQSSSQGASGHPSNEISLKIRLDLIDANPMQPRTHFDAAKILELATSIRANGVIQPLIVRRRQDRFQLVAGERRLRAAQAAGLQEVPVVVQDIADEHLLQLALIENIQREDLNPIETAHALERLAQDHGLSHEDMAQRTGKDRTTITNLLRLLKLPPDIQILLAERRLSMGHARAILGLPTPEKQLEVANRAAAQGLSVRQVERTVKDLTTERHRPDRDGEQLDPNVKAAIRTLEESLGTRVRIVEKGDHKGRIEIEYYSQDDLDRLYALIVGEQE